VEVAAPATVPPGTKQKKKWLMPLVAGIGILIVVAIVLVLVLVVFKGGSPENTMRQMFEALGDKDVSGIMVLVDPEQFKKDSSSEKAFKDNLKNSIPKDYLKFEGLVFKTDAKGDKATVTLTGGTVKYKNENGKMVSEDVNKSSGVTIYYLAKRDGNWYLAEASFPDFWSKYYVEKADKSLEKLNADTAERFTELNTLFSDLGKGVLSYLQLDNKYKDSSEKFIEVVDELMKNAKSTKSTYAKVAGLEDVEDYKKYAALREQEVDGDIKVLESFKGLLKAMGDYIHGVVTNPPSDPNAVKQDLTGIYNKHMGELQALQQETNALDAEANKLKEEFGI